MWRKIGIDHVSVFLLVAYNIIMNPEYIRIAENELASLDPMLGCIIKSQKLPEQSENSEDYFVALSKSIIGQQVSVAAARTIFNRYVDVTSASPLKVAELNEVEIKQIGLSKQKVSYLKDLAERFIENPDVYTHLNELDDELVIAELTAVKGIGVWTAQMFLMFTLERRDVFAPDDAGLQRAMMKLYAWDELPAKSQLVLAAEKWKPHRTVACLHLWQSLNNSPS